ncbi:unnamed protein product, partial [Rotaria sp. Silwood1]
AQSLLSFLSSSQLLSILLLSPSLLPPSFRYLFFIITLSQFFLLIITNLPLYITSS